MGLLFNKVSAEEKAVQVPFDASEENQEEENKGLEDMMQRDDLVESRFSFLFSLRNILTLFMSGLSIVAIIVLSGMIERLMND